MKKGKAIIAGAGPGDVELLTIKTLKYIKRADVILYDRLVNDDILKFAKKDAELIYFGKKSTGGGKRQDRINKLLVQKSKEGKLVLRLKGGDPFLFGRGSEEAEVLYDNGIEFEIIPGISSALSVPAYAGIPVTDRRYSSELHIFTGHKKKNGEELDYKTIANLKGTLVFLMGVGSLPKTTQKLIKCGKDPKTPIAIIENGTRYTQRTTKGDLTNIVVKAKEKEVKPPAIIIIGDVVKNEEKLEWFINRPLFGKRILITRDIKQAHEFSKKFNKLGGNTLEIPFLDISKSNNKLPHLKNYSTILFNSVNGVKYFFEKLSDVRNLWIKKIGAIGSRTMEELEKHKITPDLVPLEYTTDNLIRLTSENVDSNERILVVTSNISPLDEREVKEEYGINIEKFVAYNTKKRVITEDERKRLSDDKPDIITFLSSSTVDSFFENYSDVEDIREVFPESIFTTIGPVTSETLKSYGVSPEIEAKEYTTDGIVDAVMEYMGRRLKLDDLED